MKKTTLYRYLRNDGGVTISPNKPNGEHSELFRLIADEGKLLTDGEITAPCVDVYSAYGWTEIEDHNFGVENTL